MPSGSIETGRHRRAIGLLLVALLATLGGCDDSLVVCPAIAVAGLDVQVLNNTTSQPICDATVTAVEGTISERLVENACRYQGAFERPGTYTVRAERVGFAPLELSGVRVLMNTEACPHVETVTALLRLLPRP
jgi:hypothetical protein